MTKGAVGFVAGVRGFLGGLGFVVTTPAVWGWSLVPAAIATLLFGGLGTLAVYGAGELTRRVLEDAGEGAWTTAGTWFLRVVFSLLGLVISFLLAMSLAAPVSGFALDAIARKQDRALGGVAWPETPALESTLRSFRVTLTALAAGLPVLGLLAAITFFVPPAAVVTIPLKFAVTGLLAAYDLLDYPWSLRGMGVRARFRFIGLHFWGVLGFGLAAAAALLVPGVSLFLLPFGVAGAARLVRAAEASRS